MIDETLTTAAFFQQIQVELCRDGSAKTRWFMWVTQRRRRTRRKDFATPFLDHGRRTAELWYGQPVGGWRAPDEGRLARLPPGRADAPWTEAIADAG